MRDRLILAVETVLFLYIMLAWMMLPYTYSYGDQWLWGWFFLTGERL